MLIESECLGLAAHSAVLVKRDRSAGEVHERQVHRGRQGQGVVLQGGGVKASEPAVELGSGFAQGGGRVRQASCRAGIAR